ncbi:hypothetical protein ACVIHH_008396 [Bradyrhizobium sp. USDA 4518]
MAGPDLSSSPAPNAIFAFDATSTFRRVFVIMPAVYQTERPFYSASGPTTGVNFIAEAASKIARVTNG